MGVLAYIDLEIRGKDKNGEWYLYKFYATPNYIVIAKRYFCHMVEEPKEYIVEDEGYAYRVDSVIPPILVKRDEPYKTLLNFFKEKQTEGITEVSIAHGLWCAELNIIPRERRERFRKLVIEKLSEVAYYCSSIIPFKDFLSVVEETINN